MNCVVGGKLLGCGDYLVKFGRTLLVFGEYDVDLCVSRNGDDHATVDIEAHDLGIACRANILGQPLPKHIVLGKCSARIVARHLG